MTKLYSFDDHSEHKALLPEWTAKSIATVLNCTPMNDAERDRMRTAVGGLYRAAKLAPPETVVFVSSPLAGAVVATVAGATWWLHDNPEEANRLFGRAPRGAKLRELALTAADLAFQRCLTFLRGEQVPTLATDAATHDATRAATRAATHAATRAATYDATHAATDGDPIICWMIGCTQNWYRMYNAGNFWAGHCHFLSFFRDVVKLPIDYSNYNHYATAAEAGPRYTHPKFCIISDRPEFIHRDERDRPHCSDGPHIRWRDGVELHSIHGIRVTPNITAGQFTAQDIRDQRNAEVRRVMVDRYNANDSGRYLRDAGAAVVHQDVDPIGHPRRLLRIEQLGDEPYVGVELTNSTPEPDGTRKLYTLRCHPQLRPMIVRGIRSSIGNPQEMTCHNAVASLAGFYGCHYHPVDET